MYTVITRKNFVCPYCKMAIKLLREVGCEFEVNELYREELLSKGIRYVPHVVRGDDVIGGYDDLISHLSAEAGVLQ